MRHGPRPFWMHQIVEYIVGIGLVAQGLQSPAWQAPVAGGALLVAVTAATRGPLAAFRLISPAMHRRADVVVIAALVALAVQPWLPADAGGRAVLVGVAALMGVVWWQTDFRTRDDRRARRRAVLAAQAASGTDRSTEMGRRAGRIVGTAVTTVRRTRKR